MTSNKSVFLEIFGESPRMKVIDFLLENHIFDYSKRQTANFSGISYNTLETFWKQIVKLGLVKKTRKVGKSQMYILNMENPVVQRLFQIVKDTIVQDIDKIQSKKNFRFLLDDYISHLPSFINVSPSAFNVGLRTIPSS